LRVRPADARRPSAAVRPAIARCCQQDERCRRLVKVERVGPLVAMAVVAAIGNARQFTNGRELSAWLRLVLARALQRQAHGVARHQQARQSLPAQLLIHGARAAARVAERKRDARSIWLSRLKLKSGPNVAAVALVTRTRGCCGTAGARRLVWRISRSFWTPPSSTPLR
jgi:transposase